MKRRALPIVLLVAVISFVAALIGFSGNDALEKESVVSRKAPRPVPTAPVMALPTSRLREFPGLVRARQRVELAFPVQGLIVELNARGGRKVLKGAVIAKIDPRDSRNAFDMAEANTVQAKQNFERTRVLREEKVVSEVEYDRAKATFDMAAAERRIREKAFTDTVLTAPFDGVIAARYVENHEHIQARQVIATIQDNTKVEIVLQISESVAARGGAEGLKNLTVRYEAGGARWFPATLREFSTQANPVTHTYELILDSDTPSDIQIFPGMTATVRAEIDGPLTTTDSAGTLTLIPNRAIVNAPDGSSHVWLIAAQPAAPRKVPVVIGTQHSEGIEVRSTLKPGDRVATAGGDSLDEATVVRPVRPDGEGLDG